MLLMSTRKHEDLKEKWVLKSIIYPSPVCLYGSHIHSKNILGASEIAQFVLCLQRIQVQFLRPMLGNLQLHITTVSGE